MGTKIKNYRHYWEHLSKHKLMVIEFEQLTDTNYEFTEKVKLFKQGMSRCKARDLRYLKDYPDYKIEFTITEKEPGRVSLLCQLIQNSCPFSNGITLKS